MIAIAWFIGIVLFIPGIAFAMERIYTKRQGRLARLICKYNNYETAHRVLRREIWVGQTEMQLRDTRGEPARKSRPQAMPEREEWIYGPRWFGREWLRVTLEDGLVVAWGSTIRPDEVQASRAVRFARRGFI
jgi:hypothetical protein